MSLTTPPKRLSIRTLARLSQGGVVNHHEPLEPVRADRWFLCPTLTPLYHAPGYDLLSEADRLRYNQLTALMGVEVIGWFESTFLAALERAAARLTAEKDADLACALTRFADDEREHLRGWDALHAASLAAMGLPEQTRVLTIKAPGRWAFSGIARHAPACTAAFWIMLALEEHSLTMARLTLAVDEDQVDPQHRAAHRHHLRDETRHVQLDRHLIERFFASQSRVARRANATLFGWLLTRFLLPPVRGAAQVLDLLAQQRPGVRPRLVELKRQLGGLMTDPGYRATMYTSQATPVLFGLLRTFPETAPLARRLDPGGLG